MRDLRNDELIHVYGAGGSSRSDCGSSGKGSKSKKVKSSKRKSKSSKRYC